MTKFRSVTRAEAEKLYNAGVPVYRRRAKKGPVWIKTFSWDTWQQCCDKFAGHTQMRFYVLE